MFAKFVFYETSIIGKVVSHNDKTTIIATKSRAIYVKNENRLIDYEVSQEEINLLGLNHLKDLEEINYQEMFRFVIGEIEKTQLKFPGSLQKTIYHYLTERYICWIVNIKINELRNGTSQ